MRTGIYNVLHYSSSLMTLLAKGTPDYFGPDSRWKFTYKQPTHAWIDGIDTTAECDVTVEKKTDNLAWLKVTVKDKKGQSTSTVIGTLTK